MDGDAPGGDVAVSLRPAMLDAAIVKQVKRLLAEDKLSQRAIARRLAGRIAPTSVNRIATGKRRDYEEVRGQRSGAAGPVPVRRIGRPAVPGLRNSQAAERGRQAVGSVHRPAGQKTRAGVQAAPGGAGTI